MSNQRFLCPGMVMRTPDGDVVVILYVWSSASDVLNLTKSRPEMRLNGVLRDHLTLHIGNNYRNQPAPKRNAK